MAFPGTDSSNPALKFASMGVELLAAIVGMFLLGFGLDYLFGSRPWLAIAGVAVGAVGGMYNFLRTATNETRRVNAAYQREHPHRPPTADTDNRPPSADT
ncbi:MAG: AtpZ/AtpI family protein [Phycisphaerae bacterium]|nr:AtpZ/AtpI family protein [Phycisphaerae bacterium]